MLDSNFIYALEKRAEWLRWANREAYDVWNQIDKLGHGHALSPNRRSVIDTLPGYQKALACGATFFMNKKFCSLVHHARQAVPDDLQYDSSWLQADSGWMWLEVPFNIPAEITTDDGGVRTTTAGQIQIHVAAVGWYRLPEDSVLASGRSGKGATQFLCFQDFSSYKSEARGFGSWSHFTLLDGDKVIDRIRQFEDVALKEGGSYFGDHRATDALHEIRWVYTAFYLMAQKLSMRVRHDTDRHTRRRGEREGNPVTPFIEVVTLRRMEEQQRAHENRTATLIDWQWQWEVRGHWRNQYFSSTDEHKPVFIEAYIKGPPECPLKPASHKLFVARR